MNIIGVYKNFLIEQNGTLYHVSGPIRRKNYLTLDNVIDAINYQLSKQKQPKNKKKP